MIKHKGKAKISRFLIAGVFCLILPFFLIPQSASAWTCGSALVDSRDSKSYATVLIGSQCWMRGNINVGTLTAGVNDQGTDCPSAAETEKYCYGDLESSCTTYGGLYQWNQAMCGSTTAGATGICPTGWHIPTHDEFTTLELAVCTSGTCATDFPYDTSTTGDRGTNEGATLETVNSSSFSGLLAGDRHTSGSFDNLLASTYFWSSLQSGSSAWARKLSSASGVNRSIQNKTYGFSVRCIKNPDSTPPVPSSFDPASASTISDATQTITFTTDENATCKVSLTDQAYGDMSVTCSGTGTTSQSCTTPDLGADGAKNVYIACTDGSNADDADTNENLTYTLDTTGPVISSLTSSISNSVTANVSWVTSEAGSTQLEYGLTNSYGSTTTEADTSTRVTSHSVSVVLSWCATYHLRAISKDAMGNQGNGSDFTLNTACASPSGGSGGTPWGENLNTSEQTNNQTNGQKTNVQTNDRVNSQQTNNQVSQNQETQAEDAEIQRLLKIIENLKTQIQELLNKKNTTSQFLVFTKDLKYGDTDPQVKLLQQFLNAHGFLIALSGPGSLGEEVDSFGPLTKASVIKFQEKYAEEILTPLGLAEGTGFVGEATRQKLNELAQASDAS